MTAVFVSNPADRLDMFYGPRALAGLRELATVRLNPHERELSVAELAREAADCEVVVAYRGTAGTAELFGALPRLKAFVRCATDIRNIDLAAAAGHGVLVTRTGAGFAAAVAEWVMGVLVDLSRGISAHAAGYHAGVVPQPVMGRELRGSVLGVIGYGLIGREVARLAQAFGMQVLAADPRQAVGNGARQVELPVLLAQSDAVVCLATATEETENLMDARAFSAMKPGAFFLNASRGNLVDEQALRAALDSGHLAGCALDVGRAPDQMPSPELARHPRVIATPHIGGLTRPATDYQALETVRQVRDILAGRVPQGAVNAEQAHRFTGSVAGERG